MSDFFDELRGHRRGRRETEAKCPECGQPVTTAHLRDTGDVVELPDGSCPAMFAKRSSKKL